MLSFLFQTFKDHSYLIELALKMPDIKMKTGEDKPDEYH